MYFSRSIVAAALVGFGAATNHKAEGHVSTALAAAASESTGAAAVLATSSALAVHAPAATGQVAAGAAAGAQVKVHMVQVGLNGLTFEPSNVIAAAGDLVQFQFHPKNHSVVQSTFDQPCIPIQNVLANKTDAFFSGFMPTAVNSTAAPLLYTIRVMDTKPVWYYCSQGKHCQGGMVGAINAVTSGAKTVEAFKGLAAAAAENLSPGQAPGGAAAPPAPGTVAPSGAPAGSVAPTGTTGPAATTSSAFTPAEQSVNAAPGRLSGQSLLSFGVGGLAAFFVL